MDVLNAVLVVVGLSPAVTILIIGGFWWKPVRAVRAAAAPVA